MSTHSIVEVREILRQMLDDWNTLSEEEQINALSLADLKATERVAHALKFALLKTVRLKESRS